MSDRIPVLLDTDPGSDIDDAVAIAYLLMQPRCEFVGITTVTGDVAKRAAIARMICDAAGRPEVPVHAGLTGPLLHGPGQPSVPQYEPVKDRPHHLNYPRGAAIDFMRSTIRKRPGEITLLSIGPFTNVATLFSVDPEIPSLLKGMVSMAGVFIPGHPWTDHEWNCAVDPVATAIAYAKAPTGHLSVGLDVTTKCAMNSQQVAERFTGPVLSLVREMSTAWFSHRPQLVFHDPLAASLIFEPDLCRYATGQIDVDISKDDKLFGRTPFTPAQDGRYRIATDVDVEGFFDAYFGVFK